MPTQKQNSRKKVRKSSDRTASRKKHLTVIVVTQMLTLATSGFGLVAALAWNSFIQAAVNDYIKKFLPGSGITSLFIYAVLVTALAVTVTYQLSQIKEELEK